MGCFLSLFCFLHVWYLQRPEEGIGFPEIQVTGGFKWSCGYWETNLGPLQEQVFFRVHDVKFSYNNNKKVSFFFGFCFLLFVWGGWFWFFDTGFLYVALTVANCHVGDGNQTLGLFESSKCS